jgi:Cu/Ag efflux protein CusF
MKTIKSNLWMVIYATVLTTAAVISAPADQLAPTARPEKNYTGMVVSVDLQEHTLNVRGFLFNKKFNLGAACTYTLLYNINGTVSDLRPGEKVAITYQNADGVLVADSVVQQPMRYEGMVQAIDPTAHTLTLHFRGADKTIPIASNCVVVLRDEKSGALTDIQTGDHVTVIYETPDDTPTAWQIAQTSMEFTGTLTAIDLGEKTLKAKAVFTSKKFNVADNCAIVINGKPDGQLSDLQLNDKLVFSYDEINGVNVVNRIAPVEVQTNSVALVPSATTGY